MQQPEALLPTQPQSPYVGPMPPPAQRPPIVPPPQRRGTLAVIVGVTVLVGVSIGVVIGRATSDAIAPLLGPPSAGGHLGVTSKPADGNVLVDGRFVGVAPIEKLDLDPGRHSIVIDLFGYQPYSGTLRIDPRGKLNLSVLLAPIGGGGTTTGNAIGAGTCIAVVVPASALLPATASPAPTRPGSPGPRVNAPTYRAPSPEPVEAAPAPPPPRPRRDCSGEKSRCRDGCSRATSDCNFSCQGCVSCSSSVGWDECKRQCDSCKSSCERNTKFCETGCDSQSQSCEASQ